MKSLEIIKEVEEDVRKYGIVNNLSFRLEKIIQIKRDLEILELFNKMHHNKRLFKKELCALNEWLEEQDD